VPAGSLYVLSILLRDSDTKSSPDRRSTAEVAMPRGESPKIEVLPAVTANVSAPCACSVTVTASRPSGELTARVVNASAGGVVSRLRSVAATARTATRTERRGPVRCGTAPPVGMWAGLHEGESAQVK
jgi:hypothetical protein